MNIKIEQELNFVVDDSQLFLDAKEKGERTYSSSMNLAVSRLRIPISAHSNMLRVWQLG